MKGLAIVLIILGSTMVHAQNAPMDRFVPPEGYCRLPCDENSFCMYLRRHSLRENGAPVRFYSGDIRVDATSAAVLDLAIGQKDLHQCADAVIRLKSDYLYHSKNYNAISFDLTNGMSVPYAKWKAGYRIKVEGNNTLWIYKEHLKNAENNYWEYLEFIWTYAGTASLDRQLSERSIEKVKIGDILLQGGHPGHSVIVMDIVENAQGQRMMMLAQSYMPAQDAHILLNPHRDDPWFDMSETVYQLPDWTFRSTDYKAFVD